MGRIEEAEKKLQAAIEEERKRVAEEMEAKAAALAEEMAEKERIIAEKTKEAEELKETVRQARLSQSNVSSNIVEDEAIGGDDVVSDIGDSASQILNDAN